MLPPSPIWSRCPFERTAPDRVGGEQPKFRPREVSTLWLDGRGDGKDTKRATTTERIGAGITSDVVNVVITCLPLDREVVGYPPDRANSGPIEIASRIRILDVSSGVCPNLWKPWLL